MTDIEKKVLGMCCRCETIRVDNENNLWLKREDNAVLYDEMVKSFEGRISHGYCPEHYKMAMEEVRRYCEEKNGN